MNSEAHLDARHRGIGFKIGDAFPAEDPIARWATVLGMAANNTIYLNVRMIEGDLPPELNVYYFRLVAAHFFEAAEWLDTTRKAWPEVDELIRPLSPEGQELCARIVAHASQKHPLHARLQRSRGTLFHYPTMHPGRDEAGIEELANAMREAKDLDGWIEGGENYTSFRASFADDIAVQFLAENDEATREVMEELRGVVFDLVRFTELVLLEHLNRLSPEKLTVWKRGEPRPALRSSPPME